MSGFDTAAVSHVAAYLLFEKDGKIAFLKRENTSWMNGYYGLPSGKVDKGESFTQAAIREAKEEIGVELRTEDLLYRTMCYRNAEDNMVWVDVFFEVTSWDGELINAEPHMHSELTWLDPSNLPENVIPAVRFALEQIAAGHTLCEYNWPS